MDLAHARSTLKRKFHLLDNASSTVPLECSFFPDIQVHETQGEDGASEIFHLPRFPSIRQENTLAVRHCRSTLLKISYDTRQYLLALFRAHYNSYIPLIPELYLSGFKSRELEDEDASSLITHLAMLAVGLLYADSQRPNIRALRTAGARESLLHRELRTIVDEHLLQKCETGGIAALILLSELERCIGRAGSAGLYLREVFRLLKRLEHSPMDLSISDEEVLNTRAYMRAYEFIQRQWALFDHPGTGSTDDRQQDTTSSLQLESNQSRIRKETNNSELSVYHIHLELLRHAEDVAHSLQRIPHNDILASLAALSAGVLRLGQWHKTLPDWMSWTRRNTESFAAPIYLLHQQYFGILLLFHQQFSRYNHKQTTVSRQDESLPQKLEALRARCRSDALRLSRMIAEYGERFSFRNSPVILAYQIEITASALIACTIASDETAAEEMDGHVASLKYLQSALEMMSTTYKPAETMSEAMKSHIRTIGNNRITSTHHNSVYATDLGESSIGWCEAASSVVETDVSDMYHSAIPTEMEAEVTSLLDLSHSPPGIGFSPLRQATESQSASSGRASLPPSRDRDKDEERLVLVCDPVFCAYLDEMSYIVGHYGSPKDEQSTDQATQKPLSDNGLVGSEQRMYHSNNESHNLTSNNGRYHTVSSDNGIALSHKLADPSILSPLVMHLRDISSPLKVV
jgi:hypothetical protein